MSQKPLHLRTIEDAPDAEREARIDLAAAYRLAAHFRMTDTVYTHISARIPGPDEHILLNAYGLLNEEVQASNLVKLTVEGEVLVDCTGLGINQAGYVIHGAIHKARPDVMCVMHSHTVAGIAVSALEEGLLPLSQHAATLIDRVGYHDFEGIALSEDEQARLARDLGDRDILILRNHGLVTAGRSVGEAFELMLTLDRACQAQIAAMSAGRVRPYSDAAGEATRAIVSAGRNYVGAWPALRRLADRQYTDYAM